MVLAALLLHPSAYAADTAPVIICRSAQTAGMSGFRKHWDTPLPGALAFDAVHRSLLVRFPGMANTLVARLAKGFQIKRVELLLPYRGTELKPEGYWYNKYRTKRSWAQVQPQWHAIAWILRKPWMADPACGPTFNASIKGALYWTRFGAQDTTTDRFPAQFGPAEVSVKRPEGSLDLTDAIQSRTYGPTLVHRLRALEDCGVLIRKWETYDFRFREAGQGAYEWGMPTGGRAVLIKSPILKITLAPANTASSSDALPPGVDIPGLIEEARQRGADGQPTAVLPTAKVLQRLAAKCAPAKPAWMADWQWRNVQELLALSDRDLDPANLRQNGECLYQGMQAIYRSGGGVPATLDAYGAWVDAVLQDSPRFWNSWDVVDRLLICYLCAETLPAPAREHLQSYWESWLMPDRETKDLVHPMSIELYQKGKNRYYEKTGDWRGNASFYRNGFCYAISTMNFNHTAAMGALLGGKLIGSDQVMEDGRHGLVNFPLRLWGWYDGTTQESIDHYYLAVSLSAQKMFADFGPTPFDRLIGQSILAKSIHAYGGFVIVVCDATEIPEFSAFQQQMDMARLETRWDNKEAIFHVVYRSGTTHLEAGFLPHDKQKGFAYRKVNGRWPLLPAGIDRDSTLTQQGSTGRLEKNGAVLRSEKGRMAYLQTELLSGTFAGFNPLPDPTFWSLRAPGGVTIKADGKLGLARIVVCPQKDQIWVDYAVMKGQTSEGLAKALLVFGMQNPPAVMFGNTLLPGSPATLTLDGKKASVISLHRNAPVDLESTKTRYEAMQKGWADIEKPASSG